jgi:hypothetical protein
MALHSKRWEAPIIKNSFLLGTLLPLILLAFGAAAAASGANARAPVDSSPTGASQRSRSSAVHSCSVALNALTPTVFRGIDSCSRHTIYG